nr:DNA cytosine methyltransferase [Neisseria meningitidis]
MHTPLTYIDLFSGAGGLSLGFEQAGFQQLLSVEMESDYCQTYRWISNRTFSKTGCWRKQSTRCKS